MNFVFEQIRLGGDRNFGYLVGDRAAQVAAAIDPAHNPGLVAERAEGQGLNIQWILNTHGHTDHVNGNAELKQLTGAKIAVHKDSPVEADVRLDDGDVVTVGSLWLNVFFVPGHCPDHLLFHLPEQKVAITGDLLFVGKIGGTATEEDARTEYVSLDRVLDALPDDTTIWPGHDYGCRPSSTIELEKICNPFLQAKDFDAFYKLKQNWAAFKAEHGLK